QQEGPGGSGGGSAPSGNIRGDALQQFAGGTNSYYMVLALRPVAGSQLDQWVGGNGWVIWCIQ
ncbi:MAG: hypothetical protein GY772_28215, partial [bacterium]|nr:hypothetical protein [bacterium]